MSWRVAWRETDPLRSGDDLNTLIALLAAGQSRRFNGVKLAQVIDEHGTSLLADSFRKLKLVADTRGAELVVILGGHQALLSSLLPDDANYIVNHEFDSGLSSSIAKAVDYAEKADSDSLFIALADQVAITADEYLNLLGVKGEQSRVCATFEKQLSVPAIFCRDDFDKLTSLTGDCGAKSILAALNQEGKLHTVEMSSAALDIDTRTEMEQWLVTQAET